MRKRVLSVKVATPVRQRASDGLKLVALLMLSLEIAVAPCLAESSVLEVGPRTELPCAARSGPVGAVKFITLEEFLVNCEQDLGPLRRKAPAAYLISAGQAREVPLDASPLELSLAADADLSPSLLAGSSSALLPVDLNGGKVLDMNASGQILASKGADFFIVGGAGQEPLRLKGAEQSQIPYFFRFTGGVALGVLSKGELSLGVLASAEEPSSSEVLSYADGVSVAPNAISPDGRYVAGSLYPKNGERIPFVYDRKTKKFAEAPAEFRDSGAAYSVSDSGFSVGAYRASGEKNDEFHGLVSMGGVFVDANELLAKGDREALTILLIGDIRETDAGPEMLAYVRSKKGTIALAKLLLKVEPHQKNAAEMSSVDAKNLNKTPPFLLSNNQ